MFARITKLIISAGLFFLDTFMQTIQRFSRRKAAATFVVLYYHSIKPEEKSRFAHQMDCVIKRAKPIAAHLNSPLEQGVHHAVVTFDDGFNSVFENALAELAKRKIPATLFIPTAYLGQSPGWIAENGKGPFEDRVLTQGQLKEVDKDLFTIGSHCVTHRRLSFLGADEIEMELVESRNKLELIVGKDVCLLSFPHGDYSADVLERALKAGYKRAFSINPALSLSDATGYVIGRIRADPADWAFEFRLKLLGAYRWLPIAYDLKKRLKGIFGDTKLKKGSR